MQVLALDGAAGACAAGVLHGDRLVAEHTEAARQGHPALLPVMVQRMLAGIGRIDLVVVTVGPGSFTGLRAALALAHGLAAGFGCPIVGVGMVEALVADAAALHGAQRPVWVAMEARAGHVFLGRDGTLASHAIAALPAPPAGLILIGSAAGPVACALGRVDGMTVADRGVPSLRGIAVIGRQRHAGMLPPLDAQPIYVDAPAVSVPAA